MRLAQLVSVLQAAQPITATAMLIVAGLAWKGPLRMTQLATLCEVTPAAITGMVDRLEFQELVMRSRGPDRRAVTVILTDKGRQLATDWVAIMEGSEQL